MFDGMAAAQLQACVDAMEPCHLKPREVAMRAGEKCDYMYVLYSGRVVLQGASRGGRPLASQREIASQRERQCRPGEVFNEVSECVSA